ncbi:MAG: O-antigen ligase domain-containing protein [Ignavibacteriae bacterium]|nr:MAG: O-antigen ligase domain-containing protein [Ignavibacteriota bacterium]
MNYNSKTIYWLSISIVFFMLYFRSWFPGAKVMWGKEYYLILFICLCVIIINFNINKFVNFSFSAKTFEVKIIYLLFFILCISVFVYNTQEITKAEYLSATIGYLTYFFLFFVLIPQFFESNPNYFEKFVKFISNLGFFTAVFGLFTMNAWEGVTANVVVAYITHPNNTSIIFTMTSIFTVYYYYAKKDEFSVYSKIFYISSIIVQLIAQLFTYTRAGYIATFVALLFFIVIAKGKKSLTLVPILLVIVPVWGVAFFTTKGFSSFISRFYLLIPFYNMIMEKKTNFLWGFGITESHKLYRINLLNFNANEVKIVDPHNSYASLILMFGIIFTAVLLLFIFILLFKNTVKALRSKNQNERLYFTFLVTFIMSLMIQGMFDSEVIKPLYFSMQFFLIFCGLMYLNTKKYFEYRKIIIHNNE